MTSPSGSSVDEAVSFLEAHPAVQLDPTEWQERLVGGRPAA